MRYDPNIHHRRSIRLPTWDYCERGAYFVTICTDARECTLTDPSLAAIVLETWNAIPNHFANTATDEFIVMPNHVHGVIWITRSAEVGARHDAPLRLAVARPPVLQKGSLGAIVLQFKSAAARQINIALGTPGAPVWQRNYHERVIRDERELNPSAPVHPGQSAEVGGGQAQPGESAEMRRGSEARRRGAS